MDIPVMQQGTHNELTADELIKHSPMGILVLEGEQMVVRTVNAACLAIAGRREEELLGQPLMELVPELKAHGIGDILLNVFKTGIPFSAKDLEVTCTRNGQQKACYFNVVYQPLRDAAGQVKGITAMATEVTDYILVRRQLLEEEQRSRLAIESSDIGTFEWDLATNQFIYSPRMACIFGYEGRKDLTHGIFTSVIHPEDRAVRELAHQQSKATGRLRYEARLVWPDQSVHWVRVIAKTSYKDGLAQKLYGTALDITREKDNIALLEEGELRMRLMTESAELGTFDIDLLDDTSTCSPRYKQILGRSIDEPWSRDRFYECVHPGDLALVNSGREAAFLSGMLHYEVRVIWPDQSIRWIRKHAQVFYNQQKQPVRMLGIVADITEQKQAMLALQDNEVRLRVATETAELGTLDLQLNPLKVSYSERLLHIFGYEDGRMPYDKTLWSHVHPEDRALLDKEYHSAPAKGFFNCIVRIIRRDQGLRWVKINGKVLYDNNKVPARIVTTVMDITDQKNALLEVEESEQRFRAVANTAPVMIWMSGTDKRCYFLNEGWLGFTGRSMEQSTGYGWAEGIHPDDAAPCEDVFNKAFARQEEFYIEYRLKRHDGAYRWVADKGIPRISADGSFLGYIGSCIDVHEKIMSQDALEQSVAARTLELTTRNKELQQQKEFVDTILDSSMDVIAVFDKEERFMSVNKKHEDVYGVKKEDLIGKKMTEVFPVSRNMGMHLGLQKALVGEYVHDAVYKSPITGRYTELFCTPLKDNGEVYAVIAIAHDVTNIMSSSEQLKTINRELQKKNSELAFSEERYHKMVDEVKDYAIIFIDRQGFIQNWNKGAQTIKGYSEDEILGKNFRIFYSKEDQDNKVPDDLIGKAIATGKAISEGWRYRKDGTAFWANVVITSLSNEAGEVIGFSKVTRDLTERKTAEDRQQAYAEELRQKNTELERSNQELISFSYVASHDLQEPLRKINTFSEQLLEKEADRLSETGKNYFLRMQNSIVRMQKLIQDLLEYSRINTIDKKFESTSLDHLLQEVQGEFQERIEEKQMLIKSDPLPILDVIPFQIKQLFTNIISNAIKFSKEDVQPQINITYAIEQVMEHGAAAAKPRKYHRISIADNGIGFEEQYENRIFQIFQRLHGKNEYAGTGIGLAICQRVAQNHHGFMKATGGAGKGATFHLYLPVTP